jgi:hypothetical protein
VIFKTQSEFKHQNASSAMFLTCKSRKKSATVKMFSRFSSSKSSITASDSGFYGELSKILDQKPQKNVIQIRIAQRSVLSSTSKIQIAVSLPHSFPTHHNPLNSSLAARSAVNIVFLVCVVSEVF